MGIFSGVVTLFFPSWHSGFVVVLVWFVIAFFVLSWKSLPLNFYSLLSVSFVHSVQSWIVSSHKAFFLKSYYVACYLLSLF